MRAENARASRKKTIVALARELLIALWHFVRECEHVRRLCRQISYT